LAESRSTSPRAPGVAEVHRIDTDAVANLKTPTDDTPARFEVG